LGGQRCEINARWVTKLGEIAARFHTTHVHPPEGKQETTHYDAEREEECQEIQAGNKERSGECETDLISIVLETQVGSKAARSCGSIPALP
jgi:hypothetical protein